MGGVGCLVLLSFACLTEVFIGTSDWSLLFAGSVDVLLLLDLGFLSSVALDASKLGFKEVDWVSLFAA